MPSGLFALLDDVATIAKVAAASIDDVGAAAGKAGAKAAGVVVDDTAVTPRYLTGFTPDRELPIIWQITKGSLRNKLLFILPAALLLSAIAPWAMTPILMLGGSYLCYEGAEKIWHSLVSRDHSLEEEIEEVANQSHEETMVKGAIRTDFILSAEIMVIALNSVIDQTLGVRAATLGLVAVGITLGVYGVVGLIVKMDDIGLHLSHRRARATRAVGRALVHAMPHVLGTLAGIGTAAMLWVGGQIVLHGLDSLHIGDLGHGLDRFAGQVSDGWPLAGVAEWLIAAAGQGLFGLALGAGIAALLHLRPAGKGAP